ncbi:MAG: Gfo/Idh/MocA family oxidoreductase [Chloroflexi bacterium]|nr:Gfo/Idh/MocA family oxidoreductase [Chloroflexota bacterium]
MRDEIIRVGVVGAGENTRKLHIPGFQAIEGVKIVSVCNRSRESGERVASEFGIPTVYDNWRELVEADDSNAICIGTWPYLHYPVTMASLENEKHVLTEARMAMNAQEAQAMLAASLRKPYLITQVVPAPFTFRVDATIQELMAQGYLGKLLAVELTAVERSFTNLEAPIHWRHDRDLSGYNTLTMGVWYESLLRWVGPAVKVMAMTKVNVEQRRDLSGIMRALRIPDHVDIICELSAGALAHMRFSAVTGLGPGVDAWLFGSEGTLRVTTSPSALSLYGGRRGDSQLKEISIPPEKQNAWRVEEEFVNAIRGEEKVTLTTFEDGVRYMEFTEAVSRSAQTGQAISLPLEK